MCVGTANTSRHGDLSETVAREVGGRLRGRRKEVALGRLRTLTILLTIGGWGTATEGAPPAQAGPATDAAASAPATVPPVKYLEAGAKLFNSGQYALAAKYINAANQFRDRLKPSEQVVLDAYMKELAKAPADPAAPTTAAAPVEATAPLALVTQAPAPAAAASVTDVAAPSASVPDLAPAEPAATPDPVAPVADATANGASAPRAATIPVPTPPPGADAKAQAHWLLAAARNQIKAGDYDDATAKVAQRACP